MIKQFKHKRTTTINFDETVIEMLERRAKESKKSVSELVNRACIVNYIREEKFLEEIAKIKWLEFQEARYKLETARAKIDIMTK